MIRLLYTVVFFLKTFALAQECVTPYKEKGTCLEHTKCDVIASAVYTLDPQAIQFYKDSQCGCEGGMVCCGTSYNKTYPKLVNCAPAPKPLHVTFLTSTSDDTSCGLDASTDRIIGGNALNEGEFPWVAALEYINKYTKENAGIRCGGSIIHKRFILTAAHCILDVEFEVIKAWLGVTNITSEETCITVNDEVKCFNPVQKITVKRLIPHEFYNSITKSNDIGLLELETDIKYSDYIRKICIPDASSDSPSIGSQLTVVGWGATEFGILSDVKRKVEIPIQDNRICEQFLHKIYRNITNKQICAGGESGKDSCEGDSGGPLMYDFIGLNDDIQWYQHGIVSYGTGCGIPGRPGVYIKVSSYARWIGHKLINWKWNLEKDEPCTTQNGIIGMCTPLNDCHGLLTKLFTKFEYFNHKADELKKYQCGAHNNRQMVCCDTPNFYVSHKTNIQSGVLPDKTCGMLKNEPGSKEEMVDLPWIAGIEVSHPRNGTISIRCIGTVIHSRYILTTERCVFGEEEDTFKPIHVLLGRWGGTDPVQKIGIKKMIPYPYAENNPYDTYVLILLESEIKFSATVKPICLNLRNLPQLKAGDSVTRVKVPEPVTSSDLISKEELPVFKCSYWNEDVDSEGRCESGKNEDECIRESPTRLVKAPVMRKYEDKTSGRMQWYLVSMTAYEYKDCHESLRIGNGMILYLDWILTIISENK